MNKKIVIIGVCLISLVLVGVSAVSISNFYTKNNNSNLKDKNEKQEEKKKEEKYLVYAAYDFDTKKTSLYKLNEDLNEELLVDNAGIGTYSYAVIKNNLYYFDESGTLIRYDLKTKEKSTLNMKIKGLDFGYEMKAYGNYLVMIFSDGFYIYDIDKNTNELLNLPTDNYSFIFNEDRKELYYIPKKKVLYSYNIETKENKLLMRDARPLLVKNNLLYFSNLDNTKYYTYNLESGMTETISYVDFILAYYDTDKSYIAEENKIREVTKDKEETICTIDDVFLIDKMVVLEKYLLISGMYGEGDTKLYVFDIKSRKLTEVSEEEFTKYYQIIDSLYMRYVK